MICRSCKRDLSLKFIDLGYSPISNAYLNNKKDLENEVKYPLRVLFCNICWLVQTDDKVEIQKIFNKDYAYFSSYSSSWLKHASDYADKVESRFMLNKNSQVIEVASNDGYLLQHFKKKKIPCLGIEPTKSTAKVAKKKGIDVMVEFFTTKLANKIISKNIFADLIIANNVLAHVPDINDFVKSFSLILKPKGVVTFEFPHLLNLIQKNQFDTIYHEHYSYLSLIAVNNIIKKFKLEVFDIDEIQTHGGSLRLYIQNSNTGIYKIESSVKKIVQKEKEFGIQKEETYFNFENNVFKIKKELSAFLEKIKKDNKKIIAYGAAAKGNTLLNYIGLKDDLIKYVVDTNIHKQGKYLPGTGISIVNLDLIKEEKPDYIFILPWNLETEIIKNLTYVREWNCKFIIAIPELKII
jgi:2-polyprenyl-3-methyl-5-hydroxy-6-metoxy-1,4-benzoquinol methylase